MVQWRLVGGCGSLMPAWWRFIDAAGSPGGQVVVTWGLAVWPRGRSRGSWPTCRHGNPWLGGPDLSVRGSTLRFRTRRHYLGSGVPARRHAEDEGCPPSHSALRRYDGAGMQVESNVFGGYCPPGLHPAAALDGGEPQVTTSGDRIDIPSGMPCGWNSAWRDELLSSSRMATALRSRPSLTPGKRDINRTALGS